VYNLFYNLVTQEIRLCSGNLKSLLKYPEENFNLIIIFAKTEKIRKYLYCLFEISQSVALSILILLTNRLDCMVVNMIG